MKRKARHYSKFVVITLPLGVLKVLLPRRYLRKFRKQSPKGEMSREQFTPLFATSYPTAGNPSAFVDAFFAHWLPDSQKDLMDFKASAHATLRRRFAQPRISIFLYPERTSWWRWT